MLTEHWWTPPISTHWRGGRPSGNRAWTCPWPQSTVTSEWAETSCLSDCSLQTPVKMSAVPSSALTAQYSRPSGRLSGPSSRHEPSCSRVRNPDWPWRWPPRRMRGIFRCSETLSMPTPGSTARRVRPTPLRASPPRHSSGRTRKAGPQASRRGLCGRLGLGCQGSGPARYRNHRSHLRGNQCGRAFRGRSSRSLLGTKSTPPATGRQLPWQTRTPEGWRGIPHWNGPLSPRGQPVAIVAAGIDPERGNW